MAALRKLKVALIQLAVSSNKEKNVERACKFIKQAAHNGAQLICLPECFNSPYGLKYFYEYAESVPGQTCDKLSEVAKDCKIYLVGGTIPERCNDKLYNTCVAFGPTGEILAKHRKVHLFDIAIPGKIKFQESAALSAGDTLNTFNIGPWKIGLGICYDIRFPLMANIYAEKDCQLLIYPGSFNMTTGPMHWELLQRARAVDNQLYVTSISPARDETATYISWGHSSLVNPWGEVISALDEKENIAYGEIDLSVVEEIRAQIPIRNQRRNDIYDLKIV